MDELKFFRENAKTYQTLIGNLDGAVFRVFLQENNRMQFFNEAFVEFSGYPLSELMNGVVCSIDPLILESDRDRVIAEVERAVREKKRYQIQYSLKHKDGSVRVMMERGTPLFDDHGQPLFLDGVIQDITIQKNYEDRVRMDEARLESLLRISQFPSDNTQELLDYALEEAIQLTGSTIGYLYYYSEEKK